MLEHVEYPRVHGACRLPILREPITWFRPYQCSLGQLLLYRWRVRPKERAASELFTKRVIHMRDGSEILVATRDPLQQPRAVVLYLHTICGNYTQLAHVSSCLIKHGLAYATYTRAGNDASLRFSEFNMVGRINELQVVLDWLQMTYPGVPIHAVGASAGSALLIRYLGKYNTGRVIQSAVLVSAGYHITRSFNYIPPFSRSYLVNKMKHILRDRDDLQDVHTITDWIAFQSHLLGYPSVDAYTRDCDPVHYLTSINVPALFLSSLDDPIFHRDITLSFDWLPKKNPLVTMVTTTYGGHVMFEDQGHDDPWFVRVIEQWMLARL